MRLKIRKYQDKDKDAIREISYLTSSIEVINYVSKGCIEDLLTFYHTDYEPESIFVVESDDKTVGYIMGCRAIKRFFWISSLKIIPHIVLKFLRGEYYAESGLVLPLLFDLLLKRGGYIKGYPCFFHIDILSGFRKKKIGSKMVKLFTTQVCKKVQIRTNTENSGAIKFFARAGFKIKKTEKSYLLSYIYRKRVSYIIMVYG